MVLFLVLFFIFVPTIIFAIVTYNIIFSEEYYFKVIYRDITSHIRVEYFSIKTTNPQKARRKVHKLAEEECAGCEYINRIIALYDF